MTEAERIEFESEFLFYDCWHRISEDSVSIVLKEQKESDPKFIQRLMNFHSRHRDVSNDLSVIWQVATSWQSRLGNALKSRNTEHVKNALEELFYGNVLMGMDGSFNGQTTSCSGLPRLPEFYFKESKLLAMYAANKLGAIHVDNPAQACSPVCGKIPFEYVVEQIEKALQCRLSYEGGGRPAVIKVGDRYIPHKLLCACSIVASGILHDSWSLNESVLEIGAGGGWIGHVLIAMGLNEYHTIDLPTSSVIQAYLLGTSFSPDILWLHGEPQSDKHRIFIHGTDTTYDGDCVTVFNTNSFPEIKQNLRSNYVSYIADRIRNKNGIFVSINHESNTHDQRSVYAVITESKKLKLLHRNPAWRSRGYVEEIWKAA